MNYRYNPIKLIEYCILAINSQNLSFNNLDEKHKAVHELETKALTYAENELITNIEKYENNWLKNINSLDDFKDKEKFKEMYILREKFKNKIAIEWIRKKYNI